VNSLKKKTQTKTTRGEQSSGGMMLLFRNKLPLATCENHAFLYHVQKHTATCCVTVLDGNVLKY
jgi:hypothetical protein